MKVYVGWDAREQTAYDVAVHSLHAYRWDCEVIPLKSDRLYDYGLLRRPTDRRGQHYDIPSGAPISTDFAISRFLVPHLCQEGFALFVDVDVVFMDDVAKLFALADPTKAVQVVQHGATQYPQNQLSYTEVVRAFWDAEGANARHGEVVKRLKGLIGAPFLQCKIALAQCDGDLDRAVKLLGGTKMDGQVQTVYQRKNWSSVMLFNCDHPSNRRLSLQDVNERPGRDLHRFFWLHDSEIGVLPAEWNWLVGVQEKPAAPKLAHFTLGTPNLTDALRDSPHSEIWWDAYRRMCGRVSD